MGELDMVDLRARSTPRSAKQSDRIEKHDAAPLSLSLPPKPRLACIGSKAQYGCNQESRRICCLEPRQRFARPRAVGVRRSPHPACESGRVARVDAQERRPRGAGRRQGSACVPRHARRQRQPATRQDSQLCFILRAKSDFNPARHHRIGPPRSSAHAFVKGRRETDLVLIPCRSSCDCRRRQLRTSSGSRSTQERRPVGMASCTPTSPSRAALSSATSTPRSRKSAERNIQLGGVLTMLFSTAAFLKTLASRSRLTCQ
jgi:hypothetical protein